MFHPWSPRSGGASARKGPLGSHGASDQVMMMIIIIMTISIMIICIYKYVYIYIYIYILSL